MDETVERKDLPLNQDTVKTRLLLVDDDEELAALVGRGLKNDFEIHYESRGSQAISAAKQHQVEAILLDLHMPNVDGYEVLSQIKAHPLTAATPVICMSADNAAESRERATQLGAVGFISKPPNLKELSQDLLGILRSINVHLESSNKEKHFTIAFNEAEKYQLLRHQVRTEIANQHPILILSWLQGGDFFQGIETDELEKDQIIFLQVKPALIAKFPYLQDLSPLINDIKSFLALGTEKYTVLFDEVPLLFNLKEEESTLAKIFSFNEMMTRWFFRCHYFATKSRYLSQESVLHQMARLLVGQSQGIKWTA